jgi:hypothetical protein
MPATYSSTNSSCGPRLVDHGDEHDGGELA